MPQQQERKGNYAKTACIHCIKAKKRCSGDSTCDRCTERGLVCSYPITSKKRGPKFKYIIEDTHEVQGSSIDLVQSSDSTLEEGIKLENNVQDLAMFSTLQKPSPKIQDHTQTELQLLLNDTNLNPDTIANFSYYLNNNNNLIGSNSGNCDPVDPLQENFFPPLFSIQSSIPNNMNSMNTYDTTLPKEYCISSDASYDNNCKYISQSNTFESSTLPATPFEIHDFILWDDFNRNDQQ
ncbi:8781_t:CDS:2 [Acaulospora morrowiae]|uniref:8781_t:CDS:1 n=1 Tax=Acaulospora morrowiae TaxID=94023 RepID=A0A9N9GRV7_9GLOM|nr:8781_t:CDS:2 [Acaulospora morrowiae]